MMGGCYLTDDGLSRLLPGLLCCKSIKYLTLSDNFLTSVHMSGVSAVLSNNAGTLEEVYLELNIIGDFGVEKLLGNLKQCKKLKRLVLSKNHLTPRCGPTIQEAVSRLPLLEELNIGYNKLGDTGLEQVAKGLLHCSRLNRLLIDKTDVSSRSVPAICRLLSSLHSLVWISATGVVFSEDDIKRISSAANPRVNLNGFDLYCRQHAQKR